MDWNSVVQWLNMPATNLVMVISAAFLLMTLAFTLGQLRQTTRGLRSQAYKGIFEEFRDFTEKMVANSYLLRMTVPTSEYERNKRDWFVLGVLDFLQYLYVQKQLRMIEREVWLGCPQF